MHRYIYYVDCASCTTSTNAFKCYVSCDHWHYDSVFPLRKKHMYNYKYKSVCLLLVILSSFNCMEVYDDDGNCDEDVDNDDCVCGEDGDDHYDLVTHKVNVMFLSLLKPTRCTFRLHKKKKSTCFRWESGLSRMTAFWDSTMDSQHQFWDRSVACFSLGMQPKLVVFLCCFTLLYNMILIIVISITISITSITVLVVLTIIIIIIILLTSKFPCPNTILHFHL